MLARAFGQDDDVCATDRTQRLTQRAGGQEPAIADSLLSMNEHQVEAAS